MTYDLNGSLATLADGSGTTTYTWNPRDQLTGLSGPSLTASFGYDALGRRATKTVNAVQTDFLYDGLNPVQEGVLPSTPSANLLTGLGLDEFFTRTDATGLRALLTDALGSTVALADSAGAVQTEYTYAPFGATTVSGQASTNPYQFTGREHDATGLYFYRARYYSPGAHRFIAEDPVGFLGRDVNLYAYVRNSPLELVDPLGLDVWNTSNQPWLVKPENGPIGILLPGHWAPISPDGVRPPGGPWTKVPGKWYLPPNVVVIPPQGPPVCISGPCALPFPPFEPYDPGIPDDTWNPPANPPILPGSRPIPPGVIPGRGDNYPPQWPMP
jgi:RHS repeat-associated protein